jgi:hypothetical protein
MNEMIKKLKLNFSPSKQPPDDLGEKIAFFPLQKTGLKRRLSLIISLLLAAFAIILILYNLIDTLLKIPVFGRAVVVRQLSDFPLGFFLLVLSAILMFLLSKFFTRIGVHIHEDGLLVDNFFQKRYLIFEDIIEFDSRIIQSKFGNSTISTYVKIRMRNNEGRVYTIRNQFEQMDQFIKEIRQAILPALIKNSYSRLAHGKTLGFHKDICAIRTGIEIKDHFFFWHEMLKGEVSDGNLMIWTSLKRDEPLSLPIEQITNLDLLLHLISNPPIRN